MGVLGVPTCGIGVLQSDLVSAVHRSGIVRGLHRLGRCAHTVEEHPVVPALIGRLKAANPKGLYLGRNIHIQQIAGILHQIVGSKSAVQHAGLDHNKTAALYAGAVANHIRTLAVGAIIHIVIYIGFLGAEHSRVQQLLIHRYGSHRIARAGRVDCCQRVKSAFVALLAADIQPSVFAAGIQGGIVTVIAHSRLGGQADAEHGGKHQQQCQGGG